MSTGPRRIAIGGFMLESNGHAPVATRAEFAAHCLLEGEAILDDLAKANPGAPLTLAGFARAVSARGAWQPVPLVMAAVGASGPVDQGFFDEVVAKTRDRLARAGAVDAVFLSQHGAATATVDFDPDATLFRAVRAIVGPDVPIVATLDLHANVSPAMVELADVLVAYLTNPHVDMAERGAEAADILQRLFAGTKPHAAFVKLPLIPPSLSLLTKAGPYADLIRYGQSRKGPGVLNVSVVAGFSLGDTPKNGMSVIVTAEERVLAESIAREIAQRAWAERHRYVINLTSIEDATAMALACGRDADRPALLFADVADNPGGGGRGNTTDILAAFHRAGVDGALLGTFFDPELAAEAHAQGPGATFAARFNRAETQEFSKPWDAPARVVALSDGRCVGRRGIAAGRALDLGPSAALAVGGIAVVVTSRRHQCHDPAFFEMFGLDIAAARSVVVKSRGHFRAGFDEFFPDDRIVEVDGPGLATPVLTRVPWRHVKRPIYPLDPQMEWAVPAFS